MQKSIGIIKINDSSHLLNCISEIRMFRNISYSSKKVIGVK